MNGSVLARINELEKEIKVLKSLAKKGTKKNQKPSEKVTLMKGIWKKLKIDDEELEEAKRAIFDFDVEKYVK